MKGLCVYNLISVILITSLFGCGTSTTTTTESELASKNIGTIKTRSLACYYYDPTKPDFGQSFFVANLSWVWATDDNETYLYVDGRNEDGFFVIDNFYSQTFFGTKTTQTNSHDKARQFCENSIRRQKSNNNLRLYAMYAKESSVSTQSPTVFDDRDKSTKPSRIVVFGDSLSDTGNLDAKIRTVSPVGFPDAPYFLGRFSNGPNWSDYLKTAAKVAVDNWAFGGAQAVTTPDDPNDIYGTIINTGTDVLTGSLSQHVSDYISTDLGANTTLVSPEKTVYVFWIGANDFNSRFRLPGGTDILIDEPTALQGSATIIQRATAAIAAEIKRLYDIGARNFLLVNLPDLGVAPFVLLDMTYHAQESDQAKRILGLSLGLTKITQDFNASLKSRATDLRGQLTGINLVELDIYSDVKKIIAKQTLDGAPFNYGFNIDEFTVPITNPNGAPIMAFSECYTGGYSGDKPPKPICPDVAKAFFFDSVHPTTAAHCWLSYLFQKALFDGNLLDVEPSLTAYSNLCIKS